jgi:hypothetical protein
MKKIRPSIAAATVVLSFAVGAALSTAPSAPAAARKKPVAAKKVTKSKKAVDPNAPEVVAPGDIPDDQLFVPYSPASGGYTIKVPEGWGRTENNSAVTFTDKYNSITVTSAPAKSAPTIESVGANDLVDVSSDPSYRAGKITTVKIGGGNVIRATYELGSVPNKVTGKKALLAVERYVYFGNGIQVVATLSGAKGADNVDPWKIVTESVRIG